MISIYRRRALKNKAPAADAYIKYYCLFAIGFTFIYNAFIHIHFPEIAAKFIGWADSPFQIEVGTANLDFG
jgi:hypothetical protein